MKTIKLKEQDLQHIVKRVLNEQLLGKKKKEAERRKQEDEEYEESKRKQRKKTIQSYISKGYKKVNELNLPEGEYYGEGGSDHFYIKDKEGNETGYVAITDMIRGSHDIEFKSLEELNSYVEQAVINGSDILLFKSNN
jgi:hypothetical protein